MLVALVTPFTADGEVDWPASRSTSTTSSPAGADGIVVTGTTGETSTLTDPEKLSSSRSASRSPAGRAKIITGGGSNETAHAIQLYKHSEKAGADGVMIVTPYYNKPTQAGILTHFRMIADATDLPVILYDIPGRTGVPIKYETILRAAKHPNILAVKDAKGDFSEVSRVLNQTDLHVLLGRRRQRAAAPGDRRAPASSASRRTSPPRRTARSSTRSTRATSPRRRPRTRQLEPLVRAVMTHVPGTVAAKYILHGLGRISSPRVRLPLVGPEECGGRPDRRRARPRRATSPASTSRNFRPDRNAAAGGALPKVAGTTR